MHFAHKPVLREMSGAQENDNAGFSSGGSPVSASRCLVWSRGGEMCLESDFVAGMVNEVMGCEKNWLMSLGESPFRWGYSVRFGPLD